MSVAVAGAAGPVGRAAERGPRRLIAVAEAYPDLKANQNFMALQNELTSTEDRIASARRYYNANVRGPTPRSRRSRATSWRGCSTSAGPSTSRSRAAERDPVKVDFGQSTHTIPPPSGCRRPLRTGRRSRSRRRSPRPSCPGPVVGFGAAALALDGNLRWLRFLRQVDAPKSAGGHIFGPRAETRRMPWLATACLCPRTVSGRRPTRSSATRALARRHPPRARAVRAAPPRSVHRAGDHRRLVRSRSRAAPPPHGRHRRCAAAQRHPPAPPRGRRHARRHDRHLVAFTAVQSGIFRPVMGLLNVGVQWVSLMTLFNRIFGYLDLVTDVPCARRAGRRRRRPRDRRGGPDHVTFAYAAGSPPRSPTSRSWSPPGPASRSSGTPGRQSTLGSLISRCATCSRGRLRRRHPADRDRRGGPRRDRQCRLPRRPTSSTTPFARISCSRSPMPPRLRSGPPSARPRSPISSPACRMGSSRSSVRGDTASPGRSDQAA